MKYNAESKVEEIFLKKSGYEFYYPSTEKIKSIIVDNFPVLGKLTALRFIEWVQENPGGVISLPTGKTPEHFIKWAEYYLKNWKKKEVQNDLMKNGIDVSVFPDMKSLYFVQIDEFYPISPKQQNSFYYYIDKFYVKGFGLDKKRVMLIDMSKIGIPDGYIFADIFPDSKVDLSLRVRYPKTHLEELQKKTIEAVDQYCVNYEEHIRELGGIGFFLGGIGPDGHIGFNIKGSDFFSTTRLMPVNYETAAAAATDLGGIEISRNRLVITIGLSTITYNKDVVAIIIAAGEAKARIVADSIQSVPDIQYPASVLQKADNARFYLTKGASFHLVEREFLKFKEKENLDQKDIKKYLIDQSFKKNIVVDRIEEKHLKNDRFGQLILDQKRFVKKMGSMIKRDLIKSFEKGSEPLSQSTILHTAPHHDDIMLGYLPHIIHLIREESNLNYFAYMTSGFTSVTNAYMLELLKVLKYHLNHPRYKFLLKDGYFRPDYTEARNDDVYYFLDGLASGEEHIQKDATARRLLRILIEIIESDNYVKIKKEVDRLITYFRTQYPGKKDPNDIQKIKGMIREYEAELLWGYFGFNTSSVLHARLGFYTGDIFSKQPEIHSDVMPIYNILKRVNPNIVTVALDPEGSGPDTHYKVLQAVAEALKIYEKKSLNSDIRIWGYRNVWYRFHPSEANLYIPTTLNSMAILNHSFLNCFGSQRSASFPSYEYDGPFSDLAQKIMVKQYKMIKSCLGEGYFYNNKNPRIRATRGLVFLKELTLDEFYKHSQELKKRIEV